MEVKLAAGVADCDTTHPNHTEPDKPELLAVGSPMAIIVEGGNSAIATDEPNALFLRQETKVCSKNSCSKLTERTQHQQPKKNQNDERPDR